MNPPSHLGNVEGTADERSMVYVTGAGNGPQALIFIAFDPAIKLAGLKRWGGLCRKVVGEGPYIDGRATGHTAAEMEREGQTYVDVDERDRTVTVERKGKGKEKAKCCDTAMKQSTAPGCVEVERKAGVGLEGCGNWAWEETPMYLDINIGYHFGLEKSV